MFRVMRDAEDSELSKPTALVTSPYPYILYCTFIHIVASQLFPSGQSIEKRKAEAKANPKAKSTAKAKAKTKAKQIKTEPEAGGHFDNLTEADCADEPMDDDEEMDLDGSPLAPDDAQDEELDEN